jgi:hypothetical protein
MNSQIPAYEMWLAMSQPFGLISIPDTAPGTAATCGKALSVELSIQS